MKKNYSIATLPTWDIHFVEVGRPPYRVYARTIEEAEKTYRVLEMDYQRKISHVLRNEPQNPNVSAAKTNP